ncbi:glyoxylase-like metal-dependent hydrolase (beta-lactamase superfamily II) [Kineococcus rhizosphaerae]|uniref:Glyoxylase-like metal-dependent hydrolase (Beta-lactamase superfamily II) n=2 Tax=Kineococcus rhizosphaerae TaxID=559628 RepID=A0A2T0QXI2_9ACTN|nr:glyoxylase-like metal-dependent hydrolase (beta-lactamase superfamily II) [Kineococcus rhizosphaerae]
MADMKLHVLSTGVMETDLTWLLLKGGRTIRDRHHKDDPVVWGKCPTHAVLIEHPEGRILWDTGVPRDWEQRWAPTGFHDFFPVSEPTDGPGYLDSSLAELELTPDDIDVLILSHLHFDHAANAKTFQNGRTRIIANSAEIEGARAITGYSAGAHIVSDYAGLDLEAVSGDTEIVPGVSVIETPGHTWGTMSLQVDLPQEGTKIFTSDAVYLADSYGPPAVGAAIVWDNLRWLESVEKLRRIADRTGAELVFGHDADQAEGLRYAPDGHYL